MVYCYTCTAINLTCLFVHVYVINMIIFCHANDHICELCNAPTTLAQHVSDVFCHL